jgi:hypothetical protein
VRERDREKDRRERERSERKRETAERKERTSGGGDDITRREKVRDRVFVLVTVVARVNLSDGTALKMAKPTTSRKSVRKKGEKEGRKIGREGADRETIG